LNTFECSCRFSQPSPCIGHVGGSCHLCVKTTVSLVIGAILLSLVDLGATDEYKEMQYVRPRREYSISCRQSFCHLHRIPINHSCLYIDKYVEKRRPMTNGNHDSISVSSFINNIGRTLRIKSSKTELLHLFVAALLVTGVGLSFNHYRHISWQFLAIFISAFLVHELAHKLLAQYYGSWAEFRAQLLITAISALPIMPVKFTAPGAAN